jgi:hypothetical protein
MQRTKETRKTEGRYMGVRARAEARVYVPSRFKEPAERGMLHKWQKGFRTSGAR